METNVSNNKTAISQQHSKYNQAVSVAAIKSGCLTPHQFGLRINRKAYFICFQTVNIAAFVVKDQRRLAAAKAKCWKPQPAAKTTANMWERNCNRSSESIKGHWRQKFFFRSYNLHFYTQYTSTFTRVCLLYDIARSIILGI